MMKMKKKLIMLLAVLACMSASAQVKFGAKVGLDLTNFWGKHAGHKMALNYQADPLLGQGHGARHENRLSVWCSHGVQVQFPIRHCS